jgi:hypothetical protein
LRLDNPGATEYAGCHGACLPFYRVFERTFLWFAAPMEIGLQSMFRMPVYVQFKIKWALELTERQGFDHENTETV